MQHLPIWNFMTEGRNCTNLAEFATTLILSANNTSEQLHQLQEHNIKVSKDYSGL